MKPATLALILGAAVLPATALAQEQELAQLRGARDPAGQLRLGRALRRAGHFDEALRALQTASRSAPVRTDALWELARVRFDQRDFRAARAACNALPAGLHRNVCTARAHLVWNRVALAERAIALASAQDPGNGELQLVIGDARRLASDVPAAETAYRAASGALPGRAEPHLGLGALHELARRFDEALEDYRRATEADPGDPAAALALGRFLLERRTNPTEALPLLRRANEGRPRWAEALSSLGAAQLASGDAEAALASLQSAASLSPTQPGVQTALGRALVALNRHADAEAPLRLAIQQVSNDAAAYMALADVLEHTNRETEALETWDGAIDRAPSDPVPHLRAAALARRLRQYAVARAHLQRVLESDEAYAPALVQLAELAADEHNRTLAQQLYTQALQGHGEVDRALIQQRLTELAAPPPRPRRR